ncbi:MAG TPA: serine protease [Candidatus Nanoarchaeia archaeon]|nr:serine protease [Candidatus Nanoarchaeia archaeon]
MIHLPKHLHTAFPCRMMWAMEDLNQTQVILLCLLVSFVTSIGTGVITTSLLQEAPQNVTQTINRVVERTVETIVPQESGPSVVTKETTVVVKEEDLVIDAIKNSRGNLVWIVDADAPNSAAAKTIGVVVKSDGTILADKRYINSRGDYNAMFFEGGQSYPVSVLATSRKSNAVFLKLDMTAGPPRVFKLAPVANSDSLQLGQTVIAMGGKGREAVSIGRIVSLAPEGTVAANSTSTKPIAIIETDTPLRDTLAGSILLNLNGDLVGFENYDVSSGRESVYSAINLLKQENQASFQ